MNLLAIDTATEACSAALWCDGDVYRQYRVLPRGHSEHVLPMVECILAEAGLARSAVDVIACDRGPGSFTGIRIGVGVAQGIGLGLDRPVVGVSSLVVLAEMSGARLTLPAIDARMGQVYWTLLRQDTHAATGWSFLRPEQVSSPREITAPPPEAVGLGSGWDRYPDILGRYAGVTWLGGHFPDAAAVASIAVREVTAVGSSDAQSALPVYVRDQVAG